MKKLLIALLALCLTALPALAEQTNPNAVTADEMLEICGFTLEAPEGAENVELLAFPSNEEGVYALGELRFTFNGIKCVYRAQPSDETVPVDVSGLEYEWANFTEGDVAGWFGMIRSCADASVITWFDDAVGINYSFAAMTDVTDDSLIKMANIIYVPLQGDAE